MKNFYEIFQLKVTSYVLRVSSYEWGKEVPATVASLLRSQRDKQKSEGKKKSLIFRTTHYSRFTTHFSASHGKISDFSSSRKKIQ